MDGSCLKDLLKKFKQGDLSETELIRRLKVQPYENLQFARLDYHRRLRTGLPEVIFCEGKSAEQVIGIVDRMVADDQPVLATRLNPEVSEQLKRKYPQGSENLEARTFVIKKKTEINTDDVPEVCVITAGTSDIPVAEESRETLEFLGIITAPIYDVGVAGLHRFLGEEEKLQEAMVLIVVAGMEGALASVVGGFSGKPIVAVPTSVGYGTSFSGLSPLLSMLNACSSGIMVTNIDNGFGAACAAFRIVRMAKEKYENPDI